MVNSYENKVEKLQKENISMSLPTKPEYVSVVRFTASVIANEMGFNIEDIDDIKVAVGESCNNAIIHGNAITNKFDINFIVESNKLIIEIKDSGEGFEADRCPQPDLCNPRENGLGIFIIKSLMDEVDVESTVGKGTIIKMIKYLYEN